METKNGKIVHLGVNFLITPISTPDRGAILQFQTQLEKNGVATNKVSYEDARVNIVRDIDSNLNISLLWPAPQLLQLLIVTQNPSVSMELIEEDFQRVAMSFEEVWPTKGKLLLSADATRRDLYNSSSEHAFTEIWEKFLNQEKSNLTPFGRPLIGGGLRFVMAPRNNTEAVVETKIESFLRDSRKMFLEVQFKWGQPLQIVDKLEVSTKLTEVNEFLEKSCRSFLNKDGIK